MATNTGLSRTIRRRQWTNGLVGLLLVVVILGLYPVGRQVWAAWHFQAALGAIERRDFGSARRHLDRSLQIWKDSGETVFIAARTARRAGDFESADRLLQEAQRLNWVPEAIAVERSLLRVHAGEYRTVLPYLLNCVRRNHPDCVVILETLVPALHAAYEISLALECLDIWIEKEPNNPQPHLRRGELSERLRQWNDARNSFGRAVELAPNDAEARFRYGVLLLTRKSPNEALPHLEFAAQQLTTSAALEATQVIVRLASCLHELGRDQDARKLLDERQHELPDDARILELRGLIDLDAGNLDAAEALLRRAAGMNRFEPVLLSNLERCLRLNQKASEADEIQKRVAKIDADLRDLDRLGKQVRDQPFDPEPRRQIALRLMRNGLEHEGKRWLESGLQQDPVHAPTYETLADYYDQIGELSNAAKYRERAKELSKKR